VHSFGTLVSLLVDLRISIDTQGQNALIVEIHAAWRGQLGGRVERCVRPPANERVEFGTTLRQLVLETGDLVGVPDHRKGDRSQVLRRTSCRDSSTRCGRRQVPQSEGLPLQPQPFGGERVFEERPQHAPLQIEFAPAEPTRRLLRFGQRDAAGDGNLGGKRKVLHRVETDRERGTVPSLHPLARKQVAEVHRDIGIRVARCDVDPRHRRLPFEIGRFQLSVGTEGVFEQCRPRRRRREFRQRALLGRKLPIHPSGLDSPPHLVGTRRGQDAAARGQRNRAEQTQCETSHDLLHR